MKQSNRSFVVVLPCRSTDPRRRVVRLWTSSNVEPYRTAAVGRTVAVGWTTVEKDAYIAGVLVGYVQYVHNLDGERFRLNTLHNLDAEQFRLSR